MTIFTLGSQWEFWPTNKDGNSDFEVRDYESNFGECEAKTERESRDLRDHEGSETLL